MTAVQFFRYVRHEDIGDYLVLGWMVAGDLGPTHGQWSALMQWPCECALAEPMKVRRNDPRPGSRA